MPPMSTPWKRPPSDALTYTLFADGAITENPGGTGSWAWLLKAETGDWLARGFGCLLPTPALSNNTCEYEAACQALRWCLAHDLASARVEVRSDAKLIVGQVTGTYQCRAEHLRLCRDRVRAMLACFAEAPPLVWIPRQENEEADHLCRLALKKQRRRSAPYRFSEWRPERMDPSAMAARREGIAETIPDL